MYAKIMCAFRAAYLALFGITPGWCDFCGEMYDSQNLEICQYGNGYEGAICDDCRDF